MDSKLRGVEYTFHGVGQGLFASGALGEYRNGDWMGKEDGDVKFRWVYDCGTSSSKSLLGSAIQRFAKQYSLKDRTLGLVVLSHFDADHINGVTELLGQFEVDVLLLPYMPLGERIVLAYQQGIDAENPLFLFFMNPVAYLRESDIRSVRRVVFVGSDYQGPSEESNDVPPIDESESSGWPEGQHQLRLEFRSRPMSQTEAPLAGSGDATGGKTGEVSMLEASSALHIGALWEFVPYNDLGFIGPPTRQFVQEVESLAEKLRLTTEQQIRQETLSALKALYDREFGRSATARNRISLFLYSGPLSTRRVRDGRMNRYLRAARKSGIDDRRYCFAWSDLPRASRGCASILYTGDGYLNSSARLTSLNRCLRAQRLESIAVLQVMHHGARGNWKAGVARTINPMFSVFSSDPNAKKPGHPHAEVLRDFWPYGPTQVDALTDAQFHFWW